MRNAHGWNTDEIVIEIGDCAMRLDKIRMRLQNAHGLDSDEIVIEIVHMIV